MLLSCPCAFRGFLLCIYYTDEWTIQIINFSGWLQCQCHWIQDDLFAQAGRHQSQQAWHEPHALCCQGEEEAWRKYLWKPCYHAMSLNGYVTDLLSHSLSLLTIALLLYLPPTASRGHWCRVADFSHPAWTHWNSIKVAIISTLTIYRVAVACCHILKLVGMMHNSVLPGIYHVNV